MVSDIPTGRPEAMSHSQTYSTTTTGDKGLEPTQGTNDRKRSGTGCVSPGQRISEAHMPILKIEFIVDYFLCLVLYSGTTLRCVLNNVAVSRRGMVDLDHFNCVQEMWLFVTYLRLNDDHENM